MVVSTDIIVAEYAEESLLRDSEDSPECKTEAEDCVAFHSFEEMGLPRELLRGIHSYGFEHPSNIQQRAILPVLQGRDVVAQAQSGTGKTAAFAIGTLARVDFGRLACQVLVLAPTRELALQIKAVAAALGSYLNARCYACIGGTARRVDMEHLRAGQHVVVGTPGRVLDMVRSGCLGIACLKSVVLDEADEVLSWGFQDQIYAIFRTVHPEVQACLFSASLPKDVLQLSEKFLRTPVHVLASSEEPTLEGVQQFFVAVERDEWKLEVLCDLYEAFTIAQCIVYCSSQRRAEALAQALRARDFPASVLHAGIEREERRLVMREFRTGTSRILLCTDVLSRGIDVQQVNLVINYDVPVSSESYLHRIGRSGRFGRKGTAINFVTSKDSRMMREIERRYAMEMEELPADIADRI